MFIFLVFVFCSLSTTECLNVTNTASSTHVRLLQTQLQEEKEKRIQLENEVQSLRSAITVLQHSSVRTPAIAFHAILTHSLDKTSKHKLVFDHILLNIGNGYDVQTGIFTARHHGIYTFSLKLQTPGSNSDMYLMKDGQQVEFIVGGHSNDWDMSSMSVVVELYMGNEVWVDAYGTIHGHPSQHRTSFSGALLNLVL